jgi:flagellar biosynthesis protein FlhA
MAEVAIPIRRVAVFSDIILALIVIAILGVMIIPVPTPIIDILLSFNIVFSIIILLVTMYITRPLELSVFPGILLITTVFRLALNVASTRLILGSGFAGHVIQSFGTFVVQSNYVVGCIIFGIIVVIQFVVITKGATRIAEVSARFTLDAMPGKQMAIDADLNAGLIDEREARSRRAEISREADFYGAMDGASKFVRGDVVAGVIITIINIIGGFIIGIVQHKLTIQDSLRTYTMLTVGDGLVTQIPALLMSTAAGMVVTRATSESNLGQDLRDQLSKKPAAIMMAALMIALFGFIPGLPTIPFFTLSVVTGVYASMLIRQNSIAEETLLKAKTAPQETPQERVEDYLALDILGIEIGYGLIQFVDETQGGDFLDRVTILRRQLAQELGIVVPPVRIRDNIRLGPNEYTILVRGNSVARGQIEPGMFLAMNPGYVEDEIEGESTVEPAFGIQAKWIDARVREKAELSGYTVVEPSSVLATHLSEVIKKNAHEIISRQDIQKLVDNVKRDYPALVEELVPQTVPLGLLQKVLKHLLRERIPIRDLVNIMESISDHVAATKDSYTLGEFARAALYRTITKMYTDESGKLTVFTLSPQIERILIENMQSSLQGLVISLSPDITGKILSKTGELVDQMNAHDQQPVALASSSVRLGFRTVTEISYPKLAVLSYNEISPEVEVFSIGTVKVDV